MVSNSNMEKEMRPHTHTSGVSYHLETEVLNLFTRWVDSNSTQTGHFIEKIVYIYIYLAIYIAWFVATHW